MTLEVFFRPSEKLTIKATCQNVEDMFKTMGPLQEVLSNSKCGRSECGGTSIRLVHRKAADKYDVYELMCESCGAKLQLGKNDQGNLFPRRYQQDPDDPKKALMKDGKKVWLPHNGWIKWDSKQKKYV